MTHSTSNHIRIIRDYTNRDGWIGKTIADSRIAFINNLSQHILDLEPGQVWSTSLVTSLSKVDIVDLQNQITN